MQHSGECGELSVPVELENDVVMRRALTLTLPYVGAVDLEPNDKWLDHHLA